MHSFNFLATAALAFASGSHAWLLEFWETQPLCSKPVGSVADTTLGGLPGQNNTCMTLFPGIRAMKISDWEASIHTSTPQPIHLSF
ncbi:uncharacterized protein BCR38DRAFT_451880 [Pseudomassariella vexata]|uniref:Uncharacterized protein n=1 Tax=Pseudomassariella vexata TaxID=1141098 RepID=A0A1Y2D9I5_9PEZI|nr:uncharacterized protein BCR38DRAFT_451880 [Pseudomassariella vexata]ORY55918.1 hypothetical protein BCR38DRAFT_451880 [Pseudomassariella vexata]